MSDKELRNNCLHLCNVIRNICIIYDTFIIVDCKLLLDLLYIIIIIVC